MNQNELRAEWIRRLRSGEWKQTMSRLRSLKEDKFCCLGVARVLLQENGVGDDWLPQDTQLTRSEVNALGLCTAVGAARIVKDKVVNSALATLNDAGYNFSSIADLLETGDYWSEI